MKKWQRWNKLRPARVIKWATGAHADIVIAERQARRLSMSPIDPSDASFTVAILREL